MTSLLRVAFFLCLVRPITLFLLGLNIRYRERLPKCGPAILVANHNSHLDTMVLFSLFPLRLASRIRPVAAADYWLRNPFFAWFSLRLLGIIPIHRKSPTGEPLADPLKPCREALQHGDILIFFPEGTRGEPEMMGKLKSGIGRLCAEVDKVPVIPIFMRGLGKALPKGEAILVPFFCDVFVGEALMYPGNPELMRSQVEASLQSLAISG